MHQRNTTWRAIRCFFIFFLPFANPWFSRSTKNPGGLKNVTIIERERLHVSQRGPLIRRWKAFIRGYYRRLLIEKLRLHLRDHSETMNFPGDKIVDTNNSVAPSFLLACLVEYSNEMNGRFATSVYASPILNWRNVLAPFINRIRETVSYFFCFRYFFLSLHTINDVIKYALTL